MKKRLALLITLAGAGAGIALGSSMACSSKATLSIANRTSAPITVFVAFGADSIVTSLPSCTPAGRLQCSLPLAKDTTLALPLAGKYLNATLSVNGPVTCGMTKVELNLNNPAWYDIVDVSLVDGFSTAVRVSLTDSKGAHSIGPVVSQTGNEKAFGVYPYGCDLCVERSSPPCDIPKGREGCKKGPDQYHPAVPCQYQGTKKGGGTAVAITFQ